jgi:alpha/beta superfamily hydrolase
LPQAKRPHHQNDLAQSRNFFVTSNTENMLPTIAYASPPNTPTLISPSDTRVNGNTVHGYFDMPGHQIYHVMNHAINQRRAAVLLCGPTGAERERSYPTFVKWAHTLASQGCDTLRFDYRGIGESSGRFEDMTMTDWLKDAAFCATQLAENSPGVPLILHGTRAGALIASELFASGIGDALLLWAPPVSGHTLLWDTLRRNLAAQMMTKPDSPRQTREQLVAALEAGELINVDGYFWSHNLWRDAQLHTLAHPAETEPRPWHVVRISNLATAATKSNVQKHEEHVRTSPFWEYSPLFCPSSDELNSVSLRWLESSTLMRATTA